MLALALFLTSFPSHLVFFSLDFVMVPEASLRVGNNDKDYTFGASQFFPHSKIAIELTLTLFYNLRSL